MTSGAPVQGLPVATTAVAARVSVGIPDARLRPTRERPERFSLSEVNP